MLDDHDGIIGTPSRPRCQCLGSLNAAQRALHVGETELVLSLQGYEPVLVVHSFQMSGGRAWRDRRRAVMGEPNDGVWHRRWINGSVDGIKM